MAATPDPAPRHVWTAHAAIVGAACVYGTTFAITKDGLEDLSPVGFLLVRFAIGVVVLAPVAAVRLRRAGAGVPTGLAGAAFAFGLVGFAAYAFQNAGLELTTTSSSAFITGLYAVVPPLLVAGFDRTRPDGQVVVAIFTSLLGLFLLTGADLSLGRGDALTLVCALLFGVWIFLGGRYARRFDPFVLTTAQMMVFVACALPVALVGGLGRLSGSALLACVATGVVASAGAFSVQLWGQRIVDPSRTGLILLLEPVTAGIVGYFIGERLGALAYVGAALIVASIAIAELAGRVPARRRGRGAAVPEQV